MSDENFNAVVVREAQEGAFTINVEQRLISDLPPGDVLIRVDYSSLNFKDALSCTGVRRVTKKYPHTPGIDAAGQIVSSSVPGYKSGNPVIVTGFDLGANTSGGLAQYIRVPADWVVPCPENLSSYEAMCYGTAGFTAGLSLHALEAHGIRPENGPILVTGASGGVGCSAVALLARAGYEITASTGKPDTVDALINLGAHNVISRNDLFEGQDKTLLEQRWQAVVDTAGGAVLAHAIKAVKYGGAVTTCGWTSGADVPMTMYPFMLRAIQLLGIDSVQSPMTLRKEVWQRLATDWKINDWAGFVEESGLNAVSKIIPVMISHASRGRHVINCQKLDLI